MNFDETKMGTERVPELDLQKLLGFERVDAEGIEAINAEEAVAIAFNKRGEGPPV